MANVENKCCYKWNIQNFCITLDIKIDVSEYNFNFRVLKCRTKGKHPGEILLKWESLVSPIFFLSLQIYASHAQSLTIHKAPDFGVSISAPSSDRRWTRVSTHYSAFESERAGQLPLSSTSQHHHHHPCRICFLCLLFSPSSWLWERSSLSSFGAHYSQPRWLPFPL